MTDEVTMPVTEPEELPPADDLPGVPAEDPQAQISAADLYISLTRGIYGAFQAAPPPGQKQRIDRDILRIASEAALRLLPFYARS